MGTGPTADGRLRRRAHGGARGRPPLLRRRRRHERRRRRCSTSCRRSRRATDERRRRSRAHERAASQMGREMDTDRYQRAALRQPRASALGRGRRALPDAAATARWSARPASARPSRTSPTWPASTVERHERWDSCFTIDYSHMHGGSVRGSARSRYRQWMTHKLATLDRPVRHVRLRRLRPLHHVVPGRHRHHRGGGGDPCDRGRAMQLDRRACARRGLAGLTTRISS